jgi:hypothetical protein
MNESDNTLTDECRRVCTHTVKNLLSSIVATVITLSVTLIFFSNSNQIFVDFSPSR